MGKLMLKTNSKADEILANYPDTVQDKMQYFKFEGNRGILFPLNQKTSDPELNECTNCYKSDKK